MYSNDTFMRNQLHLYNPSGDYTYGTHTKLQYTKQLTREGLHPPLKLPNHFNFVTKFCTPPGKGSQGHPKLWQLVSTLLVVPLQAEGGCSIWGYPTTDSGVLQ